MNRLDTAMELSSWWVCSAYMYGSKEVGNVIAAKQLEFISQRARTESTD